MATGYFWKADWFLGVVVAIALLAFDRLSDLIPRLELQAYDAAVRASSKSPSDRIAVIAIDDQSIANIGRWPWPRDVHAKLIGQLAGAGASVIGSALFYFEPQVDPGLAYINRMLDLYARAYPGAPPKEAPGGEIAEIGQVLREAADALNGDIHLGASVARAGNVVLPLMFGFLGHAPAPGDPDQPPAEFVTKSAVGAFREAGGSFLYGEHMIAPIRIIGANAAGFGHLNAAPSPEDGAIRSETLFVDYYGQVYPSLSMTIAARSLGLSARDIKVNLGESVTLRDLTVRTDENGRMYTHFYKDGTNGEPAFAVDSFHDVYAGKLPAARYAGKIVLIGMTAVKN